ncbi:hypothetical protein BK126_11765 [Paenibacillus sp. FSL H7-0326]|uniref:hypothetical protein n=1 Tax=Paenibacillus sp. FSL H7-0326 TaxID=1921144 RepID=UPI00096C93BC|nr:hypothetical protein [Paenibacillus sp. FSL H7-0326]OMC68503.1 hypothetical protein BK126_11765 [Paenibacillus sp. FSL H7-0326]
MNKQEQQDWKRYIQGELPEHEREAMDKRLLEDQEALESYLAVLEHTSDTGLRDAEAFEKQVMSHIEHECKKLQSSSSGRNIQFKKWLNHKLVHYTLAASITLLFLSTGVFDRMLPGQLNVDSGDKQPYSEQMVRKATHWLDEIKPDPNQFHKSIKR